MTDTDVAAVAADDDFDVADDLLAAFNEAEAADAPEPNEPEGETAEQAAERVRDEKGRFAAKPETVAEVKPATEAKAAAKAAEPVKESVAAPAEPVATTTDAALRPPPGWSPAAKVAFASLPPEVQQSVAKREQEVNQGFAKLAEYKPLERYSEMAKQSGTTLDRALENYVSIEQHIGRDMVGGIAQIAQNKGVHPVALANQILARYGASPQQDGTGTTPAHQTASAVDLSPIHQELNALKSYVQQQQTAGVQSEIERFASDPKHTFFDNVKADMGRLINSGYAESLEDAYEKACWANPEIRPLLIKQQSPGSDASAKAAAATQARAASKSITGSPIPKAGSKGPETSIEDEIRQLMDASV